MVSDSTPTMQLHVPFLALDYRSNGSPKKSYSTKRKVLRACALHNFVNPVLTLTGTLNLTLTLA